MHNHYIINGSIDFYPAASTLCDLNNSDNVVVLNSPAGRCLLLLIEKNGTIVSQNEFMEIVWAQRGMQVSANTYYQNISILRKGLKKIGFKEELVVTVPRIGLTLRGGTKIQKSTTEQHLEISHKNLCYIDELALANEIKILNSIDGQDEKEEFHPIELEGFQQELTETHQTSSRIFLSPFVFWGIGVLISITLFCAVVAGMSYNGGNDFFSKYKLLTTSEGCKVFVPDGLPNNEPKSKIIEYIDHFKESCAFYPWVYFTYTPLLPRMSVIRCNKSMNESNTCISEHYFEGE